MKCESKANRLRALEVEDDNRGVAFAVEAYFDHATIMDEGGD